MKLTVPGNMAKPGKNNAGSGLGSLFNVSASTESNNGNKVIAKSINFESVLHSKVSRTVGIKSIVNKSQTNSCEPKVEQVQCVQFAAVPQIAQIPINQNAFASTTKTKADNDVSCSIQLNSVPQPMQVLPEKKAKRFVSATQTKYIKNDISAEKPPSPQNESKSFSVVNNLNSKKTETFSGSIDYTKTGSTANQANNSKSAERVASIPKSNESEKKPEKVQVTDVKLEQAPTRPQSDKKDLSTKPIIESKPNGPSDSSDTHKQFNDFSIDLTPENVTMIQGVDRGDTTFITADKNESVRINFNNLAQQLQEPMAFAANKTGETITISLSPPGLGKINIEFAQEGTELVGSVEFDNPAVGEKLESELPRVLQKLQDSGIQVREIELNYKASDQQQGPMSDKNEYHHGNGQHHDTTSERQEYGSNEKSAMTNAQSLPTSAAYIEDDAVNVLI